MLPTEKTKVKTDFLSTRTILTGAPKTGKSTFASQLGDTVLFFATEQGLDFLEVYKIDIKSFDDFQKAVTTLTTTKHKFTTVVIDVLDILIQLTHEEICKRNMVKDINEVGGGFGKGQAAARKLLLPMLQSLHDKGLGVTLVCHPKDKEYSKDALKWTAVSLNLSDADEKMFTGWADLMLYLYVDQNNQRHVRTKPNKYIQCAGDRSNKLPEVLPLDAKMIMDTLKSPKQTQATTPAQVPQIPPQKQQQKMAQAIN